MISYRLKFVKMLVLVNQYYYDNNKQKSLSLINV